MQEFIERTKYIPIRLNLSERKLLRLCEAALNVSELYYCFTNDNFTVVRSANIQTKWTYSLGNPKLAEFMSKFGTSVLFCLVWQLLRIMRFVKNKTKFDISIIAI